VQWFWYKCRFN